MRLIDNIFMVFVLIYALYRFIIDIYKAMLEDLKEARQIYKNIKEDKQFFKEILTK